jgi:hypothetical protein
MMKHTYTFQKVQYGYWGQAPLFDKDGKVKLLNVKAESLEEAKLQVVKRKDYYRRLSNGDSREWIFVGHPL